MRAVLFLLVLLNLAYLAYGMHRAQTTDLYGSVPALVLSPGTVELELLAAELDPEDDAEAMSAEPAGDPVAQ
jgi:hypothetical protein